MIPENTKISRSHDKKVILSEEYEHWTVKDLINILLDYQMDAKVWTVRNPRFGKKDIIKPIEIIGGDGKHVLINS